MTNKTNKKIGIFIIIISVVGLIVSTLLSYDPKFRFPYSLTHSGIALFEYACETKKVAIDGYLSLSRYENVCESFVLKFQWLLTIFTLLFLYGTWIFLGINFNQDSNVD